MDCCRRKKSLLLIASIIVYIDISWKCDIWSLIKYFSPTSHSAAQGPWPQYGSLWTGNKWGTLNLVSMWIDILTLNKYAHISVSGFFFFCFQRFYSDYQTAMSMLISLIFLCLSYFLTTILLKMIVLNENNYSTQHLSLYSISPNSRPKFNYFAVYFCWNLYLISIYALIGPWPLRCPDLTLDLALKLPWLCPAPVTAMGLILPWPCPVVSQKSGGAGLPHRASQPAACGPRPQREPLTYFFEIYEEGANFGPFS